MRRAAMERRRRAWDPANPGNSAIRRELVAALRAAAGDRLWSGELLDAGCGTGWWLRRLAEDGAAPERLYGIELSEERALAAAQSGADVRVGDVRALPYEDGRFAAVFLITVLSSLPGREATAAAVREAWRVLAPGGVVLVWEPRVPTPANRSTRLIAPAELEAATGVRPERRSLTVVPPLVRRLGPAAARWYPWLARVPLLRTHRLMVLRRPPSSLSAR